MLCVVSCGALPTLVLVVTGDMVAVNPSVVSRMSSLVFGGSDVVLTGR